MQTESGDRPLEGITDQWWVAVVGDMLVWARLSVRIRHRGSFRFQW